jgi:predicted Zn-dependent peptidase
LASFTADLLDEGAGGRDAVQIAEAFERLGSHLEIDAGQDLAVLTFTTLSRHLDTALALAADVVVRPHLAEADFARIRTLRLNRLRQLRTSAPAAADRAFVSAVFASHPYGHGSLGTSRSLEAVTLDEVRRFHAAAWGPAGATLIVAGDVSAEAVVAMANARFGGWRARQAVPVRPDPPPMAAPRVLLVDRPGAPQSELRIGHLGPPRGTSDYHALVTLNAALGGQFKSRINHHLRETKGYTYGARTGFDFRRACSTFACDTSVQSDATVAAVSDVLAEFEAVRSTQPIDADELERARDSLTRGYVRRFETAADLVRAGADIARFSLPDDTFDRFVPAVTQVTAAQVLDAARRWINPDASIVAVVGDARGCRSGLAELGREVVETAPEF